MTDGNTPSIRGLYQSGRSLLAAAFLPVQDAGREAALLLEHVFKLPRGGIALAGDRPADPTAARHYRQLVQKRCAGQPLQYLLGSWEFYSLPFFVGPGVLIPRPETELLVDTGLALLQSCSAPVIADLCSGSGCVAIALAKQRPDSQVYAIEKSPQAMEYLQRNRTLNAAHNLRALLGDVLRPQVLHRGERFNLVVSNPPYIATGRLGSLQPEVQLEPAMALDGGEDGLLFYKVLPQLYHDLILPGGALALEIGYDQGQAVTQLLKQAGYRDVTLVQDLSGCDRVVWGRRG